jgi:predicted metal-dependent hydrolase
MQLGLPFRDADADQGPAFDALRVPLVDSGGVFGTEADSTPNLGSMVFVRHRRARRYILRVGSDGVVRVTIPRGGSRREAQAFAGRHHAWIVEERSRVLEPAIPPATQRALQERARIELPRQLRALAAQHGVTVTRVSIRNQRTRWGSCGRNGHICLNWRLMAMPDWVRHYILIHELMHLRRLDHSPRYWKLVADACPSYREARTWLRAHGRTLR